MDQRERILELLDRGFAHEGEHDLGPARRLLTQALDAASAAGMPEVVRTIIAADIARFGEDETVIMRREGGWIRTYRAHHKDDTMTTAGTSPRP